MTGPRQRELRDSFALLTSDERWVLSDLVVGAMALLIWVAGTGALATQVAGVVGIPLGIASGEQPSAIGFVLVVLLWLVVPAIAVVVRFRRRMLNLRGNVEQFYRFDHPAALLVLPALLVIGVGAVVVTLGNVPWYVTVASVPVGLFTLVRTLAFSYRVYSFSHPVVLQVLAVLSTGVMLGGVFAAVATAIGRQPLVERVVRTAGLPTSLTVSPVDVVVPVVWVATLLPVVTAGAYVLVQTIVSLGVRLLKPDVDRSKMRTGQRYPPFLPSATPTGPSTQAHVVDDAVTAGEHSDPVDADDGAVANGTVAGDPVDGEEADAEESDEDDLDDVSNTRVFTPPTDGDETEFTAGSAGGGETRAVPATGTEADDREHCDACGESFTVDTDVRFCPNCGAALDAE